MAWVCNSKNSHSTDICEMKLSPVVDITKSLSKHF